MAQSHNVYYESKPKEGKGRLAGLPARAADFKTLEDLKPWHCVALARLTLTGGTCR